MKEEFKEQCMELINQWLNKQEIVENIEEILESLQGGKEND